MKLPKGGCEVDWCPTGIHYVFNVRSDIIYILSKQISDQEHLNELSEGCSLGDMLKYDDSDKDNLLSVNEFYSAFSKLYSKFLNYIYNIYYTR